MLHKETTVLGVTAVCKGCLSDLSRNPTGAFFIVCYTSINGAKLRQGQHGFEFETPSLPLHTHTAIFPLMTNRNVLSYFLIMQYFFLLDSSFCVAPFTVFKKLGIPGPTPIPFFGTSASSILSVSFWLFY